jgi:hypothetical protein
MLRMTSITIAAIGMLMLGLGPAPSARSSAFAD